MLPVFLLHLFRPVLLDQRIVLFDDMILDPGHQRNQVQVRGESGSHFHRVVAPVVPFGVVEAVVVSPGDVGELLPLEKALDDLRLVCRGRANLVDPPPVRQVLPVLGLIGVDIVLHHRQAQVVEGRHIGIGEGRALRKRFLEQPGDPLAP